MNFPFLLKPNSQKMMETCMHGVLCTFAFGWTLYLGMYFALSLLQVLSTPKGTLTCMDQFFLQEMETGYTAHPKELLCTFGFTVYFRVYFVLQMNVEEYKMYIKTL